MKNKVQLITYVDRLSGYTGSIGIKKLRELLLGPLKDVFLGGVHLLPFYYPIDGADAGYDPIDHTAVDPQLGSWEDIKKLSEDFDLMGDIIVNHMSSQSKEFLDVLKHGKNSKYWGLFLKYEDLYPNGATSAELLEIYRPRPGLPFTVKVLENGEKGIFWTTFTSDQMDINVFHDAGKDYLNRILNLFHENGMKLIRLDAAGYAIKKLGTPSFMIPETYGFIDDFADTARKLGMAVLVEIHSYFEDQIEIAKKVDYVYDFALPPLVLHTLFTSNTAGIQKWLKISPRNCITVLDTHDGIGVIDIGPKGELPGLVPDEQIDELVEEIHVRSKGESRKATGAAASNLDLYQVNCTYYDALGRDNKLYIMARTIQFFCPGIPQVYYVGLLAGENDMSLLEETKVGRDINRHYYQEIEILKELDKPVVKDLLQLIHFRNNHPAFDGTFNLVETTDNCLEIKWQHEKDWASLKIDFSVDEFDISFSPTNSLAPLTFRSF